MSQYRYKNSIFSAVMEIVQLLEAGEVPETVRVILEKREKKLVI